MRLSLSVQQLVSLVGSQPSLMTQPIDTHTQPVLDWLSRYLLLEIILAWCGVVWRVMAWRGVARRGVAWRARRGISSHCTCTLPLQFGSLHIV